MTTVVMLIMIVGITSGTNQDYNIILSILKTVHPESSTINECSICFDEIAQNQSKTLTCNHTYHKQCINLWLEDNINCPLCRSIVQNSNRPNKIPKLMSWIFTFFYFIYNFALTFIYDAHFIYGSRHNYINRIDHILPPSVRIMCSTSGLLVFLTVLWEHHCSLRHQDVRLEITTALFAIFTIYFEVRYMAEPNLPGWILYYTLAQLIYGL